MPNQPDWAKKAADDIAEVFNAMQANFGVFDAKKPAVQMLMTELISTAHAEHAEKVRELVEQSTRRVVDEGGGWPGQLIGYECKICGATTAYTELPAVISAIPHKNGCALAALQEQRA